MDEKNAGDQVNRWDYSKSLEKHLLVSETELADPDFVRSLVLMLSHNEEGAFGLIVNQKTEVTISKVIEGFEGSPAGDIPLYLGGPVEQTFVFTLHSGLPDGQKSQLAREIVPNMFFEPDFNLVRNYLLETWPGTHIEERPVIRIYAGYSGWAPGQVENELRQASWIVIPATAGITFAPNPEDAYLDALRKKGGIYWIAAEMGFKPSLN